MKNPDSIDPRGAYETHPESNRLAGELFDKYLKSSKDGTHSILVTGSQGIGKSTVKKILKGYIENINDKDRNIVSIDFNAFQFEENGQVTSSFYATIGKHIGKINQKLANDFKAISYLKKETNLNSLSMGFVFQILLVGLTVFLFSKISKLAFINKLLSYGFIPVADPVLGNKVILLFLMVVFIYWKRNQILKFIATRLPRLSHIDILQQINFCNQEVVIFVDEVDRLSVDSAKYLLDELLILKDSLNFNKDISNKCTICLFCDVGALKIKNNEKTTLAYLHKHFDYIHTVYISSIPLLIKQQVDKIYHIEKEMLKSYKISDLYRWISGYFTTFRDVEKLFEQLSHKLNSDNIRRVLNIYWQKPNSCKTLIFFMQSNTETYNEGYILFTVICLYIYTSREIKSIKDSNIEAIPDEINILVCRILSGCRNDLAFKNIKKNTDEIYSEAKKYELILEELKYKYDIYDAINKIISKPSTFGLQRNIQHEINIVLQGIKIKELGSEIADNLNLANNKLNLKDFDNKFHELKSLKMAMHNSLSLLNKCKKIIGLDPNAASSSINDDIAEVCKNLEIYNIECFQDDFKPIAKLILDDMMFYESEIDLKYGENMNPDIQKLFEFVNMNFNNIMAP